MLNFLKKTHKIVAPVDGTTVDLSQVPDPVFSERMTGDGVAIVPVNDLIVSPCDGTLTLLFDSKHAFAVTTDDGLEILVHVGLETVMLRGKGFTALQKAGNRVKAGAPILQLNWPLIKEGGFNLITPVIVVNATNRLQLKPLTGIEAAAGQTAIIEYRQ